MRILLLGLLVVAAATKLASQQPQRPVISSGGIVNAASYAPVVLVSGAIASIFGTNLSGSTATAQSTPLPTQLGETSLTVNGVAAPLFYVSPTQINFQMVSGTITGATTSVDVVVTAPGGSSDPYTIPLSGSGDSALGLFTADSSGCGPGAVLNVSSGGVLSLNSTSNSASPGDWIAAYGTGDGSIYNAPPPGWPAPFYPLAKGAFGVAAAFDFAADFFEIDWWNGLAPGLVGVNQMNLRIAPVAREGCAVPLQAVSGAGSMSQPVTLSIHKGGGVCVDPPSAGYGEILWQKIVDTAPLQAPTETDTLTISLQASPGKQVPSLPTFTDTNGSHGFVGAERYSGPSCPVPGYRSLDAGTITAQTAGNGSVTAASIPKVDGIVPGRNLYQLMLPPQISGLKVYQAALPPGSIQAGNYSMAAAGGADVGGFQSSLQIGAEPHIDTALAARVFDCQPLTINWTGGDPNSWITVTRVFHQRFYDGYDSSQARVSDGAIVIYPPPTCTNGSAIPIGLIVEVDPDPFEIQSFPAPGLSLGGRHLWRYVYTFGGVTVRY